VTGFGQQVRYMWQENQGLAGARNTGIRAAQGELIGLLDADDQWQPTFLENMVALADQHPEGAVYYCGARGMDVEGRDLPQVFGGPARPPDTMYQTLLRANFLIPSTIVMRRSIIMGVGLFDPGLRSCEDWDLWLRILQEHSIVGTSACLARYRLHDSSLSANPAGMQRAKQAVVEKHFGPDDGQWGSWSPEKRRAYGGLYRYHALSSVQKQNDWSTGAQYLRQALSADPTLAVDLGLFYDLALGRQPPGYRGTSHQLELEKNAMQILSILESVFKASLASELESVRRQACGTAYFALGLVAYNSDQRALCRGFLSKALYYRPSLWSDSRLTGNFLKSFVSQPMLERGTSYRDQVRKM
jgi:hypothetical protein